MRRLFGKFRRDEKGVTTVEFLVALPLLLTVVAYTMDLGLLMVRNAILEQAVDLSVRDIRLGLAAANDYEGLRDRICQNAPIVQNCDSQLKVQLNAMSPYAWNDPGRVPDCASLKTITSTGTPVFDTANRNQLVVLRACAVVDPIMPGWGLGDLLTRASDGSRNRFYQVVASTTFTKE